MKTTDTRPFFNQILRKPHVVDHAKSQPKYCEKSGGSSINCRSVLVIESIQTGKVLISVSA